MNFVKSNIKPLHTALNALATVVLAAVILMHWYGSRVLRRRCRSRRHSS